PWGWCSPRTPCRARRTTKTRPTMTDERAPAVDPAADATPAPMRARDVVRLRDFRLLFTAQAISDVGDGMTYLALYLLGLGATGSTVAVAAMAVLIALPPVTIGLFAGAVADRFDRRRLMLVSDSIRAVIVLSFVLLQGSSTIVVALALVLAQSAVGTFFSPA